METYSCWQTYVAGIKPQNNLLTQTKVNPLHRNADGETALHTVIKTVSEDGCLGYFEFTCPWI